MHFLFTVKVVSLCVLQHTTRNDWPYDYRELWYSRYVNNTSYVCIHVSRNVSIRFTCTVQHVTAADTCRKRNAVANAAAVGNKPGFPIGRQISAALPRTERKISIRAAIGDGVIIKSFLRFFVISIEDRLVAIRIIIRSLAWFWASTCCGGGGGGIWNDDEDFFFFVFK